MGSNDGVTVYQAVLESCSACSAGVTPAPVDIARNLLLDQRDSRKLRLVFPEEFKPWYDSRTLIPFNFKYLPPKLSQISFTKSNPSLQGETQSSSSHSCHLLEFSPVYSGTSCLKHQLKKCSDNQSDPGEEIDVQRSSNLQEFCFNNHDPPRQWPRYPSAGDGSNGENKLLQEGLNPLAKSFWCSSPPCINCRKRKEKGLVLEKLKETKLHQVKELHRLNYHQRGKWIVCMRRSSLKGKNLTVEQLWKKVCSLIKEGLLPYCNAKLQKTQDEVWVYCDFGHSLKIRSTLEKALGNLGTCSFYVHPVGVVMEL